MGKSISGDKHSGLALTVNRAAVFIHGPIYAPLDQIHAHGLPLVAYASQGDAGLSAV